MRVIAGSAKRVVLKTAQGLGTRPTTDRIKETLFNMLQDGVYGSRFLDLFSGSGAIGIEALSRGSSYCVFVESDREALACMEENLQKTRLSERARILGMEVDKGIRFLEGKEAAFDYIFMDPPYNQDLERAALSRLRTSSLIHHDTVIIIEAAMETDFQDILRDGWEIFKEKAYKTNKHVFVRLGDEYEESGLSGKL